MAPPHVSRIVSICALVLCAGLLGCANLDAGPFEGSLLLPADRAALDRGQPVEATLRDGLELAAQGRSVNSRYLFSQLRRSQNVASEGWQALLCAEMTLALRAGNVQALRRLGERLESAIQKGAHIIPRCTALWAIARRASGHRLPPKTPIGLQNALKRTKGYNHEN